jgi:hypothetical protein
LRALEKYRRSAAGGPVSTSAQGAPAATLALQSDIADKRAVPTLGKFIGGRQIAPAEAALPSPLMRPGPTVPNLSDQESARGNRSENALGGPRPDNYAQVRRVSSAFPSIAPRDPIQPVAPERAPALPSAPSDDPNFSGGLLGRLAALAGVDPQNPTQAAPPPDDPLLEFYRDRIQRWFVQRPR